MSFKVKQYDLTVEHLNFCVEHAEQIEFIYEKETQTRWLIIPEKLKDKFMKLKKVEIHRLFNTNLK